MRRLTKVVQRLEVKLIKPLPASEAELAITLLSKGYDLSRNAFVALLRHEYFNYDRLVGVLCAKYRRSSRVTNEEYVEAVNLLRQRVNRAALYHLHRLKSRSRKPLAS